MNCVSGKLSGKTFIYLFTAVVDKSSCGVRFLVTFRTKWDWNQLCSSFPETRCLRFPLTQGQVDFLKYHTSNSMLSGVFVGGLEIEIRQQMV